MNNVLIIGADTLKVPMRIACIKLSIKNTFANEVESNFIKLIKYQGWKATFIFSKKLCYLTVLFFKKATNHWL
jgi:hypothetical protein